jgi:hypothetical protein
VPLIAGESNIFATIGLYQIWQASPDYLELGENIQVLDYVQKGMSELIFKGVLYFFCMV